MDAEKLFNKILLFAASVWICTLLPLPILWILCIGAFIYSIKRG